MKRVLSFVLLVIFTALMFAGCKANEESSSMGLSLENLYNQQNTTLFLSGDRAVYQSYDALYFGKSGSPKHNILYLRLAYYKKETGNVLTLAEVEEYLSQEFEDDGSVRIFTNGKHPKIKDYVEWAFGRADELEKFENNIFDLFMDAVREHGDENLSSNMVALFHYAPLQWIDEIIKKEADPEYVVQIDFSLAPELPEKFVPPGGSSL